MRSLTTAVWFRTSCTTCALNCAYFSSASLPTAPGRRRLRVVDAADREAEPREEVAHPLRVTTGEVVVDGDEMRASARERVQVQRQRRDERLPLARRHLGDLPLMQHDAADELYVVRHHVPLEGAAGDHHLAAYQPAARLADRGEGLREDVVQGHLERLDVGRLGLGQLLAELHPLLGIRTVVLLPLQALDLRGHGACALGDQAAQLRRLALQLRIRQRLEPLLVAMNRAHDRADTFQLSLELGPEDLGEPTLVHQSSIRDTARASRCSRARHRAPDSGWSGPAARAPGSSWQKRPPPARRPPGGWPGAVGASPRAALTPPRPPAHAARPPGTRRRARRRHPPQVAT